MAADSLTEELLSIVGIASAEVEGSAGTPAGVKVRLAPGADPASVGVQVQAVLESHGLPSRLQGDRSSSSPPPPPGAPASVVALPTGRIPDPPGPATTDTLFEDVIAGPIDAATSVPEVTTVSAFAGSGLASVGVEEGLTGTVVTIVATDGRTATRRARSAATGVDEAIVAAVAGLSGDETVPPRLVSVTDGEIEGSEIVVVLVELGDGTRRVGAAVLEGGRAFAVASAATAAIGT